MDYRNIALFTFIVLFVIWVSRYNDLKKKFNNQNPQIINISNVVNTQNGVNNIGTDLYVYDFTITFDSTYIPPGGWGDVYAYFEIYPAKFAISTDTGEITEVSPGSYSVSYKLTQIDDLTTIGTNVNIYFVLHDDVKNIASEYQEINLSNIQCIYEKTNLKTSEGLKCAEDIIIGENLVQPNGNISKVIQITKTRIPTNHELRNDSARLYKYKNTIITYWHKIMLDETYVLPKDHPDFHEISHLEETFVYNFLLESFDDMIITEDEVILESLKPYFDEHGVEHRPWTL